MKTFYQRIWQGRAIVLLAALLQFAVPNSAISDTTWTVKKKIGQGEKVMIQTMYNINKSTCEWHKAPPKPKVQSNPKFGTLSFEAGTTKPRQCPEITINANFAWYTAGNQPGKDRFWIDWHATESSTVFRVKYVIEVQ